MSPATFNEIRKIGLALPGITEGTSYGSPALLVGGKMFACVPSHRSAEPDSLVVRLPFERRDALLREDPKSFYLKPHYLNYPTMLVRLTHVRRSVLAGLLEESRAFVAAGKRLGPRKPQRMKSPDQ